MQSFFQRGKLCIARASSASATYAVIGGLLHLHLAGQSITQLGIERRLSTGGRRPSPVIMEPGCDGRLILRQAAVTILGLSGGLAWTRGRR